MYRWEQQRQVALCSERRGIRAAKCVFGEERAVKLTLVPVSSVSLVELACFIMILHSLAPLTSTREGVSSITYKNECFCAMKQTLALTLKTPDFSDLCSQDPL